MLYPAPRLALLVAGATLVSTHETQPLGALFLAFHGATGTCGAPDTEPAHLYAARYDLAAAAWAVSEPSPLAVQRGDVCAAYSVGTAYVDHATGAGFHVVTMCGGDSNGTTFVVAWASDAGADAPSYRGACALAPALGFLSPVGVDTRVSASALLFINVTGRALVGVGVPASAAARAAPAPAALPPCAVRPLSALGGTTPIDLSSQFGHGEFALDGSADPGFPPLLLYQSRTGSSGGVSAGVNVTTWDPATGEVVVAAVGVPTHGIGSMGGPYPPLLSVFRRTVFNAGDYYTGRTGALYYATGSVSNASAAAAGFATICTTIGSTPDYFVRDGTPAMLWAGAPPAAFPLYLSQLQATSGSGGDPTACFDAGSATASVAVISHTPAPGAPSGFDIAATISQLPLCPMPPSVGSCTFPAAAHVRPAWAQRHADS